jgi:hypothetical protein
VATPGVTLVETVLTKDRVEIAFLILVNKNTKLRQKFISCFILTFIIKQKQNKKNEKSAVPVFTQDIPTVLTGEKQLLARMA